MNQQERYRFFSVMQQFKKLNMGKLIDDLSHSEFMILGMIHHGKIPCPKFYMQDSSSSDTEEDKMKYGSSNEETDSKDVTVSDLAAKLSISSPAVSKMIGILEERGLVERYTKKADRRNKYVRLTDAGEMLCEKNEKLMKDFFQEVVKRMGKDELRQLTNLLSKMYEVMEGIIEEGKKQEEDN